jgi:nucleoside-diphosphate-sugar epimerase
MVPDVRRRRVPIVGSGRGVWSFIHVDDVVTATLAAIEVGARGICNVVDDEPAAVSEWLPELARLVGGKLPFHIQAWLARMAVGEAGVVLMTTMRGAANARAKKELSWQPRWSTWRDGFRQEFGHSTTAPILHSIGALAPGSGRQGRAPRARKSVKARVER